MPLDPYAQRFLRALAASSSIPGMMRVDISQRRANFQKLMSFSEADGEVNAEDRTIPGPEGPLRIRIYSPTEIAGESLPGLVYFHGGGFVAGDLDTHDAICRALTNTIRSRMISVDYRLAPEYKFPAAVADSYAATAWIAGNAAEFGIDPDDIAVGGDSAGGSLAALVCQLARHSGIRLSYQLLLCPITDFSAETASHRAFADDPLINRMILRQDLEDYLPKDLSAAHPQISPLRATDLSDLPPAYIHTAEFDPLRDEGRSYAERLAASGTEVHYTCHPGMIHLFYALTRIIPYSRIATKLVGDEVRARRGRR